MSLREIELQQQLERRDAYIILLEKKLNEVDASIEFLTGEVVKNKRSIKNADFSLGTVYANLHKWTSEIFEWQKEIDDLEALKSNMGL